MDVLEAIRARRSIRGYRPHPVPKEILKEILEIAIRSPSGVNVQPWEFTVIAGHLLDEIKQANVEMWASGAAPSEEATYRSLKGVYRQRQIDLAVHLFQLMGIGREDKEKRAEWHRMGLRFFGAPAVIILSTDSSLDELRMQFDMGIITQSICLAALHYGLGTCIQGQGIMYPEVIRRLTSMPRSKRIVMSISIGSPDWDFPANKLENTREPVESITTWCGFD